MSNHYDVTVIGRDPWAAREQVSPSGRCQFLSVDLSVNPTLAVFANARPVADKIKQRQGD